MYENAGRKISGLANVICILGIVLSILIAIAMASMDEDNIFGALIIAVLGSVVSWLSALVLAGFGELISNSAEIRDLLQKRDYATHSAPPRTPVNVPPRGSRPQFNRNAASPANGNWKCPKCGTENSKTHSVCTTCAQRRP